jgi:hypothetical protein
MMARPPVSNSNMRQAVSSFGISYAEKPDETNAEWFARLCRTKTGLVILGLAAAASLAGGEHLHKKRKGTSDASVYNKIKGSVKKVKEGIKRKT